MWKCFSDLLYKIRQNFRLELSSGAHDDVRLTFVIWPVIWTIVYLTWGVGQAQAQGRAQQQTITVLIETNLEVSGTRFLEQLVHNLGAEAQENVHFVPTIVPSVEIQARLRDAPWSMAILSTITLTDAKIKTTAVAFEMPFLFPNMTTVTALERSPIGQAGLSTMTEQGMTGLVYLNAGVTLTTDWKVLATPSDLKGRRVAVFSAVQAEQFQKIGTVPVVYRPADFFAEVEQGKIWSIGINSADRSSWIFPSKGFLLTDSVGAQVAVVVTRDKLWNEIPFIYRSMIGDAAIVTSQTLDRELLDIERPLFEKAKLSGISLVSFKPEEASRATLQWISEQPESLRSVYSAVYEYVTKTDLNNPQKPLSPGRRGQGGEIYFATTRQDTGNRNFLYRFDDVRTDVVKCGQIQFSQNDQSATNVTFVGSVTADTRECGVFLNFALQSSKRVLIFVHGIRNRFSDAADSALALKNALADETAVVLWSWPSKRDGVAINYVYDKESAGGVAQRKFVNILQALKVGSARTPLSLLAHSMGGWHVWGALQTLVDQDNRPDLHNLVLAAPDIPDDEFGFLIESLKRVSRRNTLYACGWDFALMASAFVSDYLRAGIGGDFMVPRKGVDSIDVDASLSLNHNYVFETGKVLSDVSALISTEADPDSVVRRLVKIPKGPWYYWRFHD
jgi:esterase/lipase superfamily enzyme/TRAP-type C4-dicarboxylate transport system substrate-binding protein